MKGNFTKYMQNMRERNVWGGSVKKNNAPIELKVLRSKIEKMYYM
jgi:hypothetical protein